MEYTLLTVGKSKSANYRYPRIVFSGEWLLDMGFTKNSLVQVLPEPNGLVFKHCDENIQSYSKLFNEAKEKNGKLVRVGNAHRGVTFQTSGNILHTGGFAYGETFIAGYEYGLIRARKIVSDKLGIENLKIIQLLPTSTKVHAIKLKLYGDWLSDFGFLADSLATAAIEHDGITIKLFDKYISEYAEAVKFARRGKFKLVHVWRKRNTLCIEITGDFLYRAGFELNDWLSASCTHDMIKLQKLDFKSLGF